MIGAKFEDDNIYILCRWQGIGVHSFVPAQVLREKWLDFFVRNTFFVFLKLPLQIVVTSAAQKSSWTFMSRAYALRSQSLVTNSMVG